MYLKLRPGIPHLRVKQMRFKKGNSSRAAEPFCLGYWSVGLPAMPFLDFMHFLNYSLMFDGKDSDSVMMWQ